MDYVVGQRWISQTEPQLGLGMVIEISVRHIALSFPAVEETRTYAKQSAPLSRVHYQPGDMVATREHAQVTLTEVNEHNGLMIYRGLDTQEHVVQFTEMDLDAFVQLSSPKDRLCSGQFDKKGAFELRVAAVNHLHALQSSPVKGLVGARTNHLAHQVYIASEVAQRYAPRVLLADEVGLGKTIEAGMIMHYQLHTGRASRVLIVVPESLVHQWLVEMLRRFNLRFSIFDESRYQALLEEAQDETNTDTARNPFEAEQWVLCSQEFLVRSHQAFHHAEQAGWDLLVVDEAHHLHWELDAQGEVHAGPEYRCIERLSKQSKGLLLLTATPGQAGLASHFARLRLLDPDRFFDLARFEQEEQGYQALNEIVKLLKAQAGALSETQKSALSAYLGGALPSDAQLAQPAYVDGLIAQLLDRHGTGRVLFRNTRQAIKGFPERKLVSYPLALPGCYEREDCRAGVPALNPEARLDEAIWLQEDSRVNWLKDLLATRKQEKVLVICARAETAVALEQHLRLYKGVRSVAFHENLTLLERDRAAAYFADDEFGAQVLVCSEIGSEGRNFQFSHHLVLFDLPLNPDLLEQRIGRLDRIGQAETIHIHVPYFVGTAQEVMFRWYQEGIGLFERSVGAAYTLFEYFETGLRKQLAQAGEGDNLVAWLREVRLHTEEVIKAQEAGRDQLLELHSCNKEKAAAIIELIEEQEDSTELMEFMEEMFEIYGVDCDEHSTFARILLPTDHMRGGHFPGLQDDPVTVTFDREQALARDDMLFLSWEHPMVVNSLDMLLTSELGNACVVSMSLKALPPGTLLLETLFTLSVVAPRHLQVERYLPVTPLRFLVDVHGKELSAVLPHDKLNGIVQNLKRNVGQAVLKQVREPLEMMLDKVGPMAEARLPEIREAAKIAMQSALQVEIDRLEALKKVNPSVRQEEIAFYHEQLEQGLEAIDKASLHVSALRLVVNS